MTNDYRSKSKCDVVVITALRDEYVAVCEHLRKLCVHVHEGTIYEIGSLDTEAKSVEVAVAEVGMGNATAAQEAERAISHFQPAIAMFVGVAGGIKDVSIGDVVVATKIYSYSSGKDKESFLTRPAVANSSYPLQQRARLEAKKQDWLRRVGTDDARRPTVFLGAIASGDKVIASKLASTFRLIEESYGDALAVDMEGYGFLQAVQAFNGVQGVVIRGISDLIEDKTQRDSTGWQAIASRHASAFAMRLIEKAGDLRLPHLSDHDATSLRVDSRYSAGTTIKSLLAHYTEDAVLCAVRDVLRDCEDIGRRAGLVSACTHIRSSSAVELLQSVAGDVDEHEFVRLEARRAIGIE